MGTVPAVAEAAGLPRQQLIEEYFAGRELAPVEGIWMWSDNAYEVAIVPNRPEYGLGDQYEYVGFLTDVRRAGWRTGEVKMLLKTSASPTVFTGIYYMRNKSEVGTTFLMTSQNLIETQLPASSYGTSETTTLIRAYPSGDKADIATQTTTSGTGFIIAPGVVATNYHVVADADSITIVARLGRTSAQVAVRDVNNDIAILRASDEDALPGTCLLLGMSADVRGGDRVYSLGYPLTGLLATSVSVGEGIVSNTAGIENDPRVFQISIPIQPGNSGSPLLNSQGYVVGLVTSTLDNDYLFRRTGALPQNVNFALKSSYLTALTDMLPGATCNSAPTLISADARDLRARFGDAVVGVQASR
jgi:serine protease Do